MTAQHPQQPRTVIDRMLGHQQPTERCTICNGPGIVPGSAGEYTIDDCARCQKSGRVTVPWTTTIINLYGGPGCGKSTLAADVYAHLKRGGASVELVREYVKDWAWRGTSVGRWDQPYLIAKQLRAESALYGKVEFIITDSPILLATVFEARYQPNSYIGRELAWQIRTEQEAAGSRLRHVDLIVRREHPFEQSGRFEDEAASIEIDAACAALFAGRAPVVASVEDVLTAVAGALRAAA